VDQPVGGPSVGGTSPSAFFFADRLRIHQTTAPMMTAAARMPKAIQPHSVLLLVSLLEVVVVAAVVVVVVGGGAVTVSVCVSVWMTVEVAGGAVSVTVSVCVTVLAGGVAGTVAGAVFAGCVGVVGV
jgi:hypothetical protein